MRKYCRFCWMLLSWEVAMELCEILKARKTKHGRSRWKLDRMAVEMVQKILWTPPALFGFGGFFVPGWEVVNGYDWTILNCKS